MIDNTQTTIWDALCEMSGEDVARAFTDFYGNQLMDDNFLQFLVEEGYINE